MYVHWTILIMAKNLRLQIFLQFRNWAVGFLKSRNFLLLLSSFDDKHTDLSRYSVDFMIYTKRKSYWERGRGKKTMLFVFLRLNSYKETFLGVYVWLLICQDYECKFTAVHAMQCNVRKNYQRHMALLNVELIFISEGRKSKCLFMHTHTHTQPYRVHSQQFENQLVQVL